MSARRLVFCSAERQVAVAERLATETGQHVAHLGVGTGPLALRKVIVDMGTDAVGAVVATERWAIGWRAPLGWSVEFDESFTQDRATRFQAQARVPLGLS